MEITNELRAAAIMAYNPKMIKSVKYGLLPVKSLSRETMVAIYQHMPMCLSYNFVTMQLHRLSDITDEHAIEVAKAIAGSDVSIDFAQFHDDELHIAITNWPGVSFRVDEFTLEATDYIRSKSYALPFRGIDLIESGIAEYVK